MDFSFFVPFELLPWQWVAWIGFGICIGLLKAGFSGISVIMIPVMALIFGARASTGILLPVYCFADLLAVLYYRRHAEWKYILRLLPWTLAGFVVAILVERLVPVQAFKYLMGVCIIAGLIVMVWNDLRGQNKPPPSGWWFSAFSGVAGGFATMIGNISGAFLSVFLLSMRLPKNSFVGTTAWYFLIINYLKLPIQIFIWKNITVETLLFNSTLIPAVLAGLVLGIVLIKKISEPLFRKIIIVLTFISTALLFI
jgi:hypothetical protein